MQVEPDWTTNLTSPEEFQREFEMPYAGPGFYLADTDTLLVVPTTQPASRVWHKLQPKGEVIRVYVWNCAFHKTVFSVAAITPVRHDKRAH